jgi:hypothetical protein
MSDSPPPYDPDRAYQAQRPVMSTPLTPAEIAAQNAAKKLREEEINEQIEERRRRDRQWVMEQQSIDAGRRSAQAFYDGQHSVTKTAPGAANKPPYTPWQNPLHGWQVKTKQFEQTQQELDAKKKQIDEQRELAKQAEFERRQALLKKADDEDVLADKARQLDRFKQGRHGGRRKSASIKSKRKSKKSKSKKSKSKRNKVQKKKTRRSRCH